MLYYWHRTTNDQCYNYDYHKYYDYYYIYIERERQRQIDRERERLTCVGQAGRGNARAVLSLKRQTYIYIYIYIHIVVLFIYLGHFRWLSKLLTISEDYPAVHGVLPFRVFACCSPQGNHMYVIPVDAYVVCLLFLLICYCFLYSMSQTPRSEKPTLQKSTHQQLLMLRV